MDDTCILALAFGLILLIVMLAMKQQGREEEKDKHDTEEFIRRRGW